MADNTVLLTGVTGFVGGALASQLAQSNASMVAVVRASTIEHARARVAQSLARFLGGPRASEVAERMTVLLGDLGDTATFDNPTFDEVTHVVHLAACTSFASTCEVWRSNVAGTLLLARRMQHVQSLKRFVHVSTAYCCGAHPNRVVFEGDSPRADHTYVNEYSRTKAEIERELAKLADRLPLFVARPSIVIGHSTLGVQPSSSLFWYYRALAMLGNGPFSVASLRDIVPVDYVAEALEFLLFREAPRTRVFHISAGESGTVPVLQILRSLGMQSSWRTVTPTELGTMVNEISKLVGTKAEARKLTRGLVACAQFGTLGVDYFDNSRLLSEGFRAPPRFLDYLPVCISTSSGTSIYEQMVDEA